MAHISNGHYLSPRFAQINRIDHIGSYGNRKAATVAHLSNQFRSGQIQSLGIVLDVLYLIGFMT